MDKKFKMVLAGNFEEYQYFLSSIFPHEAQALYVYAHNVDKVRGLRYDSVIVIGTFYDRKDAMELRDEVIKYFYA